MRIYDMVGCYRGVEGVSSVSIIPGHGYEHGLALMPAPERVA